MEVSYKLRSSQSPWLQVMRFDRQLARRSVDRGKTEPWKCTPCEPAGQRNGNNPSR